MAQGLKYADAVKLLGGAGPLLTVADNLAGTALLLGTAGGSELAVSLFDAKGEATRIGHQVAGRITDLVRGQGRFDRSERLHAAHAVLAVSSFFTALGDCLDTTGVRSPEFSRDDQVQLVVVARSEGSWQSRLLDAAIPVPSPDLGFDRLLDALADWFTTLSKTL
ncbi:MAG TPA: hypothetical protein VN408_27540, partial [Actinoplanes sp.]|nr:hypothetical protein [Actinoplanes sp.]